MNSSNGSRVDIERLSTVTRTVTGATTVREGFQTALAGLCEFPAWDYAEVWTPDDSGTKLTHAASHSPDERFGDFRRRSRETTFDSGEGLPGRIWMTGDAEWLPNVAIVSPGRYPRTELAARAGLGAALGVPVEADDRIEAVLVCYSTEYRRPEGRLKAIVETVAATLGEFVARKRNEDAVGSKRDRELDRLLVDHASDGFFVVDPDTGEFVDVNEAACDQLGYDRDELLSLSVLDINPEASMESWQDFVARVHERGPVTVESIHRRADGTTYPVEIRATNVTLDREYHLATVRDVTERKARERDVEATRSRYEDALRGVNAVAQDLTHAETDVEIAHVVVDVATDVIDALGVSVYLYDEQVGELVPVAHSDRLEDVLDDLPRFSARDSIAWRVFSEGEPAHFDDVRTDDDVYNAGTPIRSEILVPLGDHGVFVVGDTDADAFDEVVVEIAELLGATVEAALDRAERTHQLRKRERQSQIQAQRLARVHRLNEEIRTIARAIVRARSRAEIMQTVCDSLTSLDQFACAWIGEPDAAVEQLTVEARARCPTRYFETVSLDLDSDNALPAVRATRDRTTVVEPNVADRPRDHEWRTTALAHDLRSVISVPLLHEDVLYGTLTVYSGQPDNFESLTTEVIRELGTLVGYALNAVDRRNALLGNGGIDLILELSDVDDVFVGLAADLSTQIQIENVSHRSEGTFLIYFVATVAPDDVVAVVEETPLVDQVRVISSADPARFEVVTTGECIATVVADLGAIPGSIVVDEDRCRLDVSIPADRDKQTFLRHVRDRYPDADVAVQQDATADTAVRTRLLEDCLTDRQQDVLDAAYYSGYFDRPRARTGTEIAASLDISQPAFSKQLRTAQKKLLAAIYADDR